MKINMIGKKFNRLLVIEEAERTKDNHIKWLCICDCGKKTVVDGRDLRANKTKSCGCLCKELIKINKPHLKHGKRNLRIYHIWLNMKDRCNNKNNSNYKYYGERGINVCESWQRDFMTFYEWAMANGYQDNLTIDRIDVNGNYEPSNCRWITLEEQQNNKTNSRYITYDNKTYTISSWEKMQGFKRGLVRDRLKRGWTIERALTEKVKK